MVLGWVGVGPGLSCGEQGWVGCALHLQGSTAHRWLKRCQAGCVVSENSSCDPAVAQHPQSTCLLAAPALPPCLGLLQKKALDEGDAWLMGGGKKGKGKAKKGACFPALLPAVSCCACQLHHAMPFLLVRCYCRGAMLSCLLCHLSYHSFLPQCLLLAAHRILLRPAARAAEEKKAEKGPEKLAHSLDILEAFATLQLEVPLYKDKVAPLVPLVAAKKEHFLAK